ncbi:MAG: murein biosynthesis integral membrane protein MurJ [Frankiaceae bacterium]
MTDGPVTALATPVGPSLARAAVAIGAVTVAARLVGFARGLVLVRTVGAGCVGDTYYAANAVPNIVFEVVAGGALASVVVPLLAGPVQAGDAATVTRIASALLTWATALLVPVTLAGIVLARPVMGLLAGPSLAAYDRAGVLWLGSRLLVVFMPQAVLYGAGIVLTGVLQAHRRFLGPAVAPLLSSLVVIGAYLAFAVEGGSAGTGCAGLSTGRLLTLALGTTAGVAMLSLSLLVPLRATGVRLRPSLAFPPGVAPRARALALAGVAALSAQQLATALVLRLSYGGPAGTLVLYNLAWALFLLPWAVLAVPIATSAFPRLSARADAGDPAGFARDAAATTRAVVLVTAAATAALVAAAPAVARLLVLHAEGHPDPAALARAVAVLAPGLIGYGLVAHLGRALYARHEGRRAAAATVTGWAVVAATDLVLVQVVPHGHRLVVLAAGNTVGMTAAGALLALAIGRVTGGAALAGLRLTGPVALAAAAVGGGCGLALAGALPGGGIGAALWQAGVAAGVGLAAFVAVTAALDRGSLHELARLVPAGRRHG